jgi:NADH-quinone oxidoreductase subunit N
VNDNTVSALKSFIPVMLPEVILGLAACVLFLGATFKVRHHTWGLFALVALGCAGVALFTVTRNTPTLEEELRLPIDDRGEADTHLQALRATIYAAPVLFTKLALFFKVLALITGAALILLGWDEAGDDHAGEFHGCLLLIVAGMSIVGSANDLITLFLALELVSIPTYIMLYLSKEGGVRSQEAAMKYFLLSIFSSALMLFGFSYLYGLTGTTNIPAILDALGNSQADAARKLPWVGVSLLAIVMVVAGLGFRITAVPFHFYAPDVYEGTSTPMAALLAFVPKVVGFAALLRVLGYVLTPGGTEIFPGLALGVQLPMLLWIMAAVTMTLGNILALLQNNLRRMFAYSGVAHSGYMLVGLAVVPYLPLGSAPPVGGVEALLFYLVAYGAMTVGLFAVLHYLGGEVENVDDLAGLGRSHPGLALILVLFLFSMIGIPLTAGFMGKFFLFIDALGLPPGMVEQTRLYRILAVIMAVNAAIGAGYYLRLAVVMYLREGIEPLPPLKPRPVLGTIWFCAILTLALGVYPGGLLGVLRSVLRDKPSVPTEAAALPVEPNLARR